MIKPAQRMIIAQALMNLTQFVLNRLAYEAAVIVAAGGIGQDSMFYEKSPTEAWGDFGLDIAGEAVGTLSDTLEDTFGFGLDLCKPPNQLLNLNLAIGFKQEYQPGDIKCDIMKVGQNWKEAFTNTFGFLESPAAIKEATLTKFAQSLHPGRNELSASAGFAFKIHEKVEEEKQRNFIEQANKDGYKDVTDFVTGKTETPADTMQKQYEETLAATSGHESRVDVSELMSWGDIGFGMAAAAGSTFTNTLLSKVLQNVYDGLFQTEPDDIDPFNIESLAGSGKESAQDALSELLAINPISVSDYNILNEFSVCAASGGINRGLNSCVLDSRFAGAITKAQTGQALTVQEAIDAGDLHGDWPLISPEAKALNQDPLCYKEGYCYGNLVKLRKARILPIGWELAAQKNDKDNPTKLQEIVDGFSKCNDNGEIDDTSDHKWCHLIDPNWVIKYPETQCRAQANGEIRLSTYVPGRTSVCVDTPSCIGEDNDGKCSDGFGYCVSEKNVWRFRGNDCPAQYASCLSFTNTTTSAQSNWLVRSVDFSVCGQSNAGCQWYRTNKFPNDQGTVDDPTDDAYEWLAKGETYSTLNRDGFLDYTVGNNRAAPMALDYVYGGAQSFVHYAYQDRRYLTHSAQACDAEQVGCSELYSAKDLTLNILQNPSFEKDEDNNNIPDAWLPNDIANGNELYSGPETNHGTNSLSLEENERYIQRVPITENNFYTLTFDAKAQIDVQTNVIATVTLLDYQGDKLNLGGLVMLGDCDPVNDDVVMSKVIKNEWTKLECTFTTPPGSKTASVSLNRSVSNADVVYFDTFQLELGENSTPFTIGYNTEPSGGEHIKLAPGYLGCDGIDDPKECEGYAQMCRAQDVGCNLYSPKDNGPNVPAITTDLDVCPSECVGYTTFKQEKTDWENEKFPVYFIADKSTACQEQNIGCDSFTNINTVATGGEGVEAYTYLRACVTEGMTSNAANKQAAVFYTWEGSDKAGFQLKTWNLLESNYFPNPDTLTFEESNVVETKPSLAPCTKPDVINEDEVVCDEDAAHVNSEAVKQNSDCDEHADIFTNPDCREFFDSQGNIHYREWSETVTVDNSCAPYRKNEGDLASCNASGGFWTNQGFCRYFGLQKESNSCPVSESGCREYTGGASRNASTIINETFENEDFGPFVELLSARVTASISNESLAYAGHSVSAIANDDNGIATWDAYVGGGNKNTLCTDQHQTYDADRGMCIAENSVDADLKCEVAVGKNGCSPISESLVSGKTFILRFWAKGSSGLKVGFKHSKMGLQEYSDLVDTANQDVGQNQMATLPLTGSWKLYELGPFDSSKSDFFSNLAKLVIFKSGGGDRFFIDNIELIQVEDNLAIIKDSWVVPSTCDSAPNGLPDPQYYLGCRAYKDKDQKDVNLYQFSSLCSEEVVGCEAFYQTQQSASAYKQVFNARCQYDSDNNMSTDNVSSNAQACAVQGVTYCTIPAFQSFCLFDATQTFPEKLPSSGDFRIVYGPETTIVDADKPVYAVNDESASCSSAFAGCQEFGKPKFEQDLSQVTEFESVYFMNTPTTYGDDLCDDAALFCEEYESTSEGNFYFKDPISKTCDYKTNVNIRNKNYLGWFRSNSDEPCYFTDDNGNDKWDDNESAHIVSGENMAMWSNGDVDNYDGWVGVCENQYDMCSEFVDVVDTGGGLNPNGASYYFLDDKSLDESHLPSTQKCDGKAGQKFGCGLFNNKTNPELTFNTNASYVASTHADVLLDKGANELIDPINCNIEDNGKFTISEANKQKLNLISTNVDLCTSRCEYQTDEEDSLETSLTTFRGIIWGTHFYYERSCLVNEDCPKLQSENGENLSGTCGVAASQYRSVNDANTVLKVNRDRTCASWLEGRMGRQSWNTRTNKWETIYRELKYCVPGVGERCEIVSRDSTILSTLEYSKRDVNWSGVDYSGFSIPNQLPVEQYSQENLNPDKWCKRDDGDIELNENDQVKSCDDESDCSNNYECKKASKTFILAYNAGSCDRSEVGQGGECKIGFCSVTKDSCAFDENCEGNANECVIGYCQAVGNVGCPAGGCVCESNPDCNGVMADANGNGIVDNADLTTPICDTVQQLCVNELMPNANSCDSGLNSSCDSPAICNVAFTTSQGACFNDKCLTDIVDTNGNGFANSLNVEVANKQSCRGYPEIDSPFPLKVVSTWSVPTRAEVVDRDADVSYQSEAIQKEFAPQNGVVEVKPGSKPFSYINGYEESKVCEPNKTTGKVTDDCLCSYDKVEYGDGVDFHYYEIGASADAAPPQICLGGPFAGMSCTGDEQCMADNVATNGTCVSYTKAQQLYGWPGYCIEKDSSISLYASTDQTDRACLTWLPVDQLKGATDLFAKYTGAGFPPSQTLYCAEETVAYDIATTDVGCAEIFPGVGYCGWDEDDGTDAEMMEDINDDNPHDVLDCPSGFFAIMTMCDEELALNDCENGDNDYPYFCVPYHSSKIEDGNEILCEPPDDATHHIAGGFVQDIYVVHDGPFKTKYSYYQNCTVRGILHEHIGNYLGDGATSPANYPSSSPGDLRYDLDYNYIQYSACKSLVEVGKAGSLPDNGEMKVYNVGWTNRLWEESEYNIEPDGNLKFNYSYLTDPSLFGQSKSLQSILNTDDPVPPRAIMCKKGNEEKVPENQETSACPAGFNDFEGNREARPYYEVKLASSGFEAPVIEYCKEDGCVCADIKECNWQNDPDPNNPGRQILCGIHRCNGGINNGNLCEDVSDCPSNNVCDVNNNLHTGQNWACGWQICHKGKCLKPCQLQGDKICIGGPNDQQDCENTAFCRPNQCYKGDCTSKIPKPGGNPMSELEEPVKAKERLQQIFARSLSLFEFDDGRSAIADEDSHVDESKGEFEEPDDLSSGEDWHWDVRAMGDEYEDGTPYGPKVMSVGDCLNTLCEEGPEGEFNVNEKSSGTVSGVDQLGVSVSFFTKANPNQLPIRRIVVDWGADYSPIDQYWPTDKQSGSTAPDNFYKNYRGIDSSKQTPICNDSPNNFGESYEACNSGYISFKYDYTCTRFDVQTLEGEEMKLCKTDVNNRLINSPCTGNAPDTEVPIAGAVGACVFQPRVHVLDNWGWCTGHCDAGDEDFDNGPGCYSGKGPVGPAEINECNIDECPGNGNGCPDFLGGLTNPWVNFNGYVIVRPE